jgi:hypothetical protein
MEVVERVITREQRNFLLDPIPVNLSSAHKNMYNEITRLCQDQIWIWEGKDPKAQRQYNKPGQHHRSRMNSMGKRVKAYKKEIAAVCPELGKTGPHKMDLTPLIDRDELERFKAQAALAAAPPGVPPIVTFFPPAGTFVARASAKKKRKANEDKEADNNDNGFCEQDDNGLCEQDVNVCEQDVNDDNNNFATI